MPSWFSSRPGTVPCFQNGRPGTRKGTPITTVLHGLDAIGWDALRHAYGAAGDVPALLRAIADGDDPLGAVDELDVKIYHQGGAVFSAAAAALPFLTGLAASAETDAGVRAAILDTVGRLADEARLADARAIAREWPAAWDAALPRLLALLADPDAVVRRAAVSALDGAAADADTVTMALRARRPDEDDPAARLEAVLVVGGLAKAATAAVLPETLAWLRDLCGDPDPDTRLAALLALAEAVPAQRLGDDLDAVVAAARQAEPDVWRDVPHVGDMPDDLVATYGGMPARLVTWIGAHLEDEVPARTRLCLAFGGDRDADRRIGAVRNAADLLSAWRSPAGRLVPLLAERTADGGGPARAYATHVLAAMAGGPDGARDGEVFAARLDDPHRLARHNEQTVADVAAWGLARLGDARCVPYLAERLAAPNLGYGTAVVGAPAAPGTRRGCRRPSRCWSRCATTPASCSRSSANASGTARQATSGPWPTCSNDGGARRPRPSPS
ncbi:hypothetical protein ACFQHO_51100 [Actinomadura yumaensis]|uniref:hypothetical protein n=1 Tax=Actinomadura yumaensis TaxID=111807 RepID=UPI00361BCDF0